MNTLKVLIFSAPLLLPLLSALPSKAVAPLPNQWYSQSPTLSGTWEASLDHKGIKVTASGHFSADGSGNGLFLNSGNGLVDEHGTRLNWNVYGTKLAPVSFDSPPGPPPIGGPNVWHPWKIDGQLSLIPKCEFSQSTCRQVTGNLSLTVAEQLWLYVPGIGGSTGWGGVSKQFTSYTKTGIEVPGPLPILGVTAAFGFSRKLRKRIKVSKPEAISTI